MTSNAQAALSAAVEVVTASLARDAAAARANSQSRNGYFSVTPYSGKGVIEKAVGYLAWLNDRDAEQAEAEELKAKGTLEERVTRLEEDK